MASYTLILNGTDSANVSSVINSTKVKVIANGACYYAINENASPLSNVGPMIPGNFPTYINMQGIGNTLSICATNSTGTSVTGITITECGTVYQSAVNQNSTTFYNT